MSKMNEKTLRPLGDEELSAVSGAGGLHLGLGCRKHPYSVSKSQSIDQQNSVGNIIVFAPGNKGTVDFELEQVNQASQNQ